MNKFKSIIGAENFGGFRIMSRDLSKKLISRGHNIYAFLRRSIQETQEKSFKRNYIMMKAQDRWHP